MTEFRLHHKFLWNPHCTSSCRGRKGACAMPFRRKPNRHTRHENDVTRGAYQWRKFKAKLGWAL